MSPLLQMRRWPCLQFWSVSTLTWLRSKCCTKSSALGSQRSPLRPPTLCGRLTCSTPCTKLSLSMTVLEKHQNKQWVISWLNSTNKSEFMDANKGKTLGYMMISLCCLPMLGGLVVFSVDRDSQTVSGDCGWMDCSRPSVWPSQGVHHPEVCRDSDQQEHYLPRFWWLHWLLTETFAPGTRTSQWTTGTSGMPHTHCTACPRRWRMRRSWTTQPAGAREGIRAPATGSSPWCLS